MLSLFPGRAAAAGVEPIPAGCLVSPFPTTPTGPSWSTTLKVVPGGTAKMTAWRQPCAGGDAVLLITLQPVWGTPRICFLDAFVEQDGRDMGVQFHLHETNPEPLFCGPLTGTVTVWPGSLIPADATLDDDQPLVLRYLDARPYPLPKDHSPRPLDQLRSIVVPAYDPAQYAALPALRRIQPELSGTFSDPARSGEGMVVDVGEVNGIQRISLLWFTYRDGRPLWLHGTRVYPLSSTGPLELEMFETAGAAFGAAFRPQDVRYLPWGTLTLEAPDCDTLRVRYRETGGSEGELVQRRAMQRQGQADCL